MLPLICGDGGVWMEEIIVLFFQPLGLSEVPHVPSFLCCGSKQAHMFSFQSSFLSSSWKFKVSIHCDLQRFGGF